ncbi:MAG: WG repeat-containing protein [Crocinitomicaceae bacterium]|nr:WG repeat-containing protein [Crocinitomicaceae bacterium]
MKKIIAFFILATVISSCGDSEINTDAFCDGDILIPFQKKNGKDWGFINMKGEVIVKPEFDQEPSFGVNGIALVYNFDVKEHKTEYFFVKINDGKVKESWKKWDLAGEFHDGLAPVRKENEQIKFINENFKVVFTAKAEEVAYFNEGLAAFKNKEGKWGFLNKKGKVAIKAKYDFVRSGFMNGRAIVGSEKDDERTFKIINKSAKTVLNLKDKYDNVISISEDLIKVEENGYGFINLEGKKVIPTDSDWDAVTDFINGYASFYEDGEWGLVDTDGKRHFNAKFENPIHVFNDMFWYRVDGKWGVMNMDGEDVIKPQFRSDIMPYPFFCETSIVGDGRLDMIFIDREGVEIGMNEYDRVAQLDYKYVSSLPWNETFESDLFDPSSFTDLVSMTWLDKSDAVSFLKELGITKEEVWNDDDKAFDYSRYSEYYYYARGSDSFEFVMYARTEPAEYESDAIDIQLPGGDDYRSLLRKYRERDTQEEDISYSDRLLTYTDRTRKKSYNDLYGLEEEIVDSKYPLDAPVGISAVNVRLYFDDYVGVSEAMDIDEARYYYGDGGEEQELDWNKETKITAMFISITLEGKGYGKANQLAKALGKKWKSKITEVKTESNKEKTYKIEGETTSGSLIIRNTSRGTVTIEINFDREED